MEGSVQGRLHSILLDYNPFFSFIFLKLDGEPVQDKKGNKVLVREVNH